MQLFEKWAVTERMPMLSDKKNMQIETLPKDQLHYKIMPAAMSFSL